MKELGDSGGHLKGQRAGGPATQAARGKKAGRAETRVARAGIALARGTRSILKQNHMVYDLRVARLNIERTHPVVLRRRLGNDEAPVEIGAVRRHFEGGSHLYLEVRLAELPAGGKCRRGGRLFRVALRRSGIRPLRQK